MRPTHVPFIVCAFLFVQSQMPELPIACAEERTAEKEIERTIQQFFSSMSKRDVEGLRAALDTRFLGIEAGMPNAEVHVIDTTNAKQILPPQGNDDWDNVGLADVRVQISATHPSVATAAFALVFPLDDREVSHMENILRDPPLGPDDAQRQALRKWINAKCITNSMFAMLAKRKGQWKIMCMTFPK